MSENLCKTSLWVSYDSMNIPDSTNVNKNLSGRTLLDLASFYRKARSCGPSFVVVVKHYEIAFIVAAHIIPCCYWRERCKSFI